jgi:AraC-like DNA-binding protein
MEPNRVFKLSPQSPITASRGGLFRSTGHGHHKDRVLDSYELIFVISGCLELFEEDVMYRVRPNETLLLWPSRHHGAVDAFPENLSFYWVHFFLDHDSPQKDDSGISLVSHAQVERPERLKELYNWYLDQQETLLLTPTEAACLVTLILCEASRSTHAAEKIGNAPIELAHKIDSYISQHFSESLSTSCIANSLNYNVDYLERVYHEKNGISITEAILKRRLREARAHLQFSGDMNINEIAFACGYSDPSYFRRVFKQEVKMTPKQFRSLYSQITVNTGSER